MTQEVVAMFECKYRPRIVECLYLPLDTRSPHQIIGMAETRTRCFAQNQYVTEEYDVLPLQGTRPLSGKDKDLKTLRIRCLEPH
jgi:hypothetical protein